MSATAWLIIPTQSAKIVNDWNSGTIGVGDGETVGEGEAIGDREIVGEGLGDGVEIGENVVCCKYGELRDEMRIVPEFGDAE